MKINWETKAIILFAIIGIIITSLITGKFALFLWLKDYVVWWKTLYYGIQTTGFLGFGFFFSFLIATFYYTLMNIFIIIWIIKKIFKK